MNYKEFYTNFCGTQGSLHEFLKAEEVAASSATDDTDDDKWYVAYYKAAQMGCSPVNGEIEVVADRLALL
jgi:hypothetical protein